MTRILYIAALAALTFAGGSRAAGNLADIAIIDRDSGATLAAHYYRGDYWVAGSPGARYAIEIRNRLGERLLAVTSVDGVNVVSGATAGWDQTGYVFGADESYQITGWRKSDAEVAAFSFTASPNSYAERTGRPGNVGVIGVALFRERAAVPQPPPPPVIGESMGSDAARRASNAPAAGAPPPLERDSLAKSLPNLQALRPKLGTAHGAREYSYASHTQFVRMQTEPNEVIRIRYDSMDNLMAMGIIARRRPMPPTPNAFPDSAMPSYVPDPPG